MLGGHREGGVKKYEKRNGLFLKNKYILDFQISQGSVATQLR